MLKGLGAIGILLVCTCFGFLQALHYSKRPKQIRQIIHAFQRLETEITYGHTPLYQAFLNLSKQMAPPFADCFSSLATQLSESHHFSLDDGWGQAFRACFPRTSLKKPEMDIILQLGHVLGISDSHDQIKHLRLAISQLQFEEGESRQDQKKYESMWRSLGCLLGVLIVILLS